MMMLVDMFVDGSVMQQAMRVIKENFLPPKADK